jgi:hypothetical protein
VAGTLAASFHRLRSGLKKTGLKKDLQQKIHFWKSRLIDSVIWHTGQLKGDSGREE